MTYLGLQTDSRIDLLSLELQVVARVVELHIVTFYSTHSNRFLRFNSESKFVVFRDDIFNSLVYLT